MMNIQICVGSNCHLKGSPDIVKLFRDAIESHGIQEHVKLDGSFCLGKCNRIGVSVSVDDVVHTGVTMDSFQEFFQEHVLSKLEER